MNRSEDPAVQYLLDRVAIAEVKARYYRFLDTKDWTGLRSLYADDARFLARGVVHEGGDAVVAFIVSRLGPEVTSVHHGHQPEIDIDGDHATAIWPMEDEITRTDGTGFAGAGYYTDKYVRSSQGWLIAESSLTRFTFRSVGEGYSVDEALPPEVAR